jgi:hypothetical protein
MPRSDRPSNVPGAPPRRVRRRPGASRSSMLATPLALSYVSVAAMMLVRLIGLAL